jgi:hypothetical protein
MLNISGFKPDPNVEHPYLTVHEEVLQGGGELHTVGRLCGRQKIDQIRRVIDIISLFTIG